MGSPFPVLDWGSSWFPGTQADPHPACFLIERFPFDTERPGSLRFVSLHLFKHPQDVLPLHLFQRRRVSRCRRFLYSGSHFSISFTFDVCNSNLSGNTENGETLDEILQFADVAGPTHSPQ